MIPWICHKSAFGSSKATKNTVEEALILLLEKNKPKDNSIGNYRKTIDKDLKQMLNLRRNIFAKKWIELEKLL